MGTAEKAQFVWLQIRQGPWSRERRLLNPKFWELERGLQGSSSGPSCGAATECDRGWRYDTAVSTPTELPGCGSGGGAPPHLEEVGPAPDRGGAVLCTRERCTEAPSVLSFLYLSLPPPATTEPTGLGVIYSKATEASDLESKLCTQYNHQRRQ